MPHRLLLVLVAAACTPQAPGPTAPEPIVRACTKEAKICPDGSSVGREGPNCEFAPCPVRGETLTPDPAPPTGPDPEPDPVPMDNPPPVNLPPG